MRLLATTAAIATTFASLIADASAQGSYYGAAPKPKSSLGQKWNNLLHGKPAPAQQNLTQQGLIQQSFGQQPSVGQRFQQTMAGAANSIETAMTPATKRAPDPLSLDQPVGPIGPELALSMATMAEQQGNLGQARQQLQKAVAANPNNIKLLRKAGQFEDRQGQLAEAEQLYGRAVSVNPQHTGALNDLALCLARQGKLEASAGLLQKATQLNPTKTLYRNNLAKVLLELNNPEQAFAQLAKVHGDAGAYYNLGQLFAANGNTEQATHHFQAALRTNPQFETARVALAKLQSGRPAGFAANEVNQSETAPASRPGPATRPVESVATPNFPRLLPPTVGTR